MICDAHAWIGHWPFQSLPERTATGLLRQMDRNGIDKALVGNLNGLLYKDAHEANHELAREVRRHRDRLVPCAAINPTYSCWREDLQQCRDDFGMPVLRLVPDYHGYKLTEKAAEELVAEAHALKMTPAIVWRVVDPRGRHPLDPGREARDADVLGLVNKFPKASFLMLNFRGVPGGHRMDKPACYFDITQFMGRNGLRMEEEIRKYGADRFVFGSGMLLRYGKPARIGLDACRLTKAQREAIHWRNLSRMVKELR